MMRMILCSLAITIMMATQAARAADDTGYPLQGAWTVVSGENDGKSDDDVVGDQLTFEGDKMTTKRSSGKVDQASFTVDPKAKPAAIDIKPNPKVTVLGIYEITGDSLKICFRAGQGDRPTDFSGKPDSHLRSLVLKRDKK